MEIHQPTFNKIAKGLLNAVGQLGKRVATSPTARELAASGALGAAVGGGSYAAGLDPTEAAITGLGAASLIPLRKPLYNYGIKRFGTTPELIAQGAKPFDPQVAGRLGQMSGYTGVLLGKAGIVGGVHMLNNAQGIADDIKNTTGNIAAVSESAKQMAQQVSGSTALHDTTEAVKDLAAGLGATGQGMPKIVNNLVNASEATADAADAAKQLPQAVNELSNTAKRFTGNVEAAGSWVGNKANNVAEWAGKNKPWLIGGGLALGGGYMLNEWYKQRRQEEHERRLEQAAMKAANTLPPRTRPIEDLVAEKQMGPIAKSFHGKQTMLNMPQKLPPMKQPGLADIPYKDFAGAAVAGVPAAGLLGAGIGGALGVATAPTNHNFLESTGRGIVRGGGIGAGMAGSALLSTLLSKATGTPDNIAQTFARISAIGGGLVGDHVAQRYLGKPSWDTEAEKQPVGVNNKPRLTKDQATAHSKNWSDDDYMREMLNDKTRDSTPAVDNAMREALTLKTPKVKTAHTIPNMAAISLATH